MQSDASACGFHLIEQIDSVVGAQYRPRQYRQGKRAHDRRERHLSRASQDFASHEFVTHSKDLYVRGDIHTNTIEGYFSIFKRGMKGVYQHCAEHHLHRYLAEFDFR